MPSVLRLSQGTVLTVPAVLDKFLRIKVDIEHIRIITGQGLGNMRIHDAGAAGMFVCFLRHGIFMLDAHHIRDILAHAKEARTPGSIRVFQLRALELPLISGGIREIFKKDIGRIHGKGDLILPHEIVCRLIIKDLHVGEPDYIVRFFLMRVIRKSLVTGEIYPGLRIFGESHPGHIVQQGGNGLLQLRDLPGGNRLLFRLVQLFSEFLVLPVIVRHHRDDENKKSQGDSGIQRICTCDRSRLFLKVSNPLFPDGFVAVIRRMGLVIFKYPFHRFIGRLLRRS